MDTNTFHWKSLFSICERLRKISIHIVYEGVESRSDGVHWIHWTRIDSTGIVYFLFVRHLEKFQLILYEGVESRSDGVHWIDWTRIDSTGIVYFLFVRHLEKLPLMLYEGWKVVPMESIGSIGHE